MKHDERGLVPVDGTHAGWRGGSRPEVREIPCHAARQERRTTRLPRDVPQCRSAYDCASFEGPTDGYLPK